MKMKTGTRIVFSIYILIILAICAAIIISVLGIFDQRYAEELINGFMNTNYKYIWEAAAAVMFIVGVALLFFGTGKREVPTVALEEGTDGSVKLTIAAVEELVARYLGGLSGIIVQKTDIKAIAQRSVAVKLNLSVKAGVSVPEITGTIKGGLVEYIDKFTGLTISSLDIRIMPMAAGTASAAK